MEPYLFTFPQLPLLLDLFVVLPPFVLKFHSLLPLFLFLNLLFGLFQFQWQHSLEYSNLLH